MESTAASSVRGTSQRMSGWSWGQRALARIAALEALCRWMALRPDAAPRAQELRDAALERLAEAREAINGRRRPWFWFGPSIDKAQTNMNAADCLVLRYMPLKELAGRMPEVVAFVQEHLPTKDPRRLAVEELVRTAQKPLNLDDLARETIVTTVGAAFAAQEREYIRVRSFRNMVYGFTIGLTVLALGIGVLMASNPRLLPICFQPEKKVVCPTASESYEAGRPNGANKPYESKWEPDLDDAFGRNAHRWDYALIELIGLTSAAVAAAVALLKFRGTATPYRVPIALALLKLPTGALTAILGLLLMRGEFVPGLSALDSSAQIVAWAVIFGYAQQLFTRLVDERGQEVINGVGSAENPLAQDSRPHLTQATSP
jgi:hypothetical protein